jgi:AcrR family transcriptional regulator
VFGEKGFEAATLHDVADRVELDRATLYYYVGSKEEALRDILIELPSSSAAISEGLLAEKTSAIDKLMVLVRHIIESYEGDYPNVLIYLQEALFRIACESSAAAAQVVTENKRLDDLIGQILQQGIDKGELRPDISADVATQMLWGILTWAHRRFQPEGRHNSHALACAFTSIFIQGMSSKAE